MTKLLWTRRRAQPSLTLPTAEALRERLAATGPQAEFLGHFDARAAKYVAFVGGVGSGKSHLGAHYALEMAARNPDVRGFIAANTYPQLWQSTLTALYKVARHYGVFDEGAGFAHRGTFFLDPDGVVRWALVNEPGARRDFSGFHATLASIIGAD